MWDAISLRKKKKEKEKDNNYLTILDCILDLLLFHFCSLFVKHTKQCTTNISTVQLITACGAQSAGSSQLPNVNELISSSVTPSQLSQSNCDAWSPLA